MKKGEKITEIITACKKLQCALLLRGEQNIPPQPIPQSGTYEVPKEQPASGTFEHPEQNMPSNANEQPMQHVSRANQNKGKYDKPSPAIAAYAAPAFKPTGYYRDGKDGVRNN